MSFSQGWSDAFLMIRLGLRILGRKTIFSSLLLRVHAMNWLITGDVKLAHLAEMLFVRFLYSV